MDRLPPAAVRHLTCPGAEWEEAWADLPRTFVHGDAKVGNCAILADGRVSVFDWALAGSGPCAIDLGWYIAVNATRLTVSKDEFIARYRVLLEAELGRKLPDGLWNRLEVAAVVHGARMLLWSKALALEAGRLGAESEWNWWVERLAVIDGVESA
jgi:aminoglycoside phosphotransferase (APT) family kinase protein